MRVWKDERGQALILVAICLAILLGFMGMAIDVGLVYRTRQNVQIAADAASQAAALDYLYNLSATSAQTAGKAASASNGFTDGSDGVHVTVNVPPSSGAVASIPGYAEAIVTRQTPTSFLSLFGFRSMTVTARAVAGDADVADGCVWLMAKNGTGLDLQGNYDIESPTCGIYVNSNSTSAINVTGNGGTVNAKFLDVVGNSDPSHETTPTPVSANSVPRTAPYTGVHGPDPANDCGVTSSATKIDSSNISSLSGYSVVCFSKAVTLSNVTLPGASSGVVYLFEKGVSLSGTVTFGSSNYDASSGTFSSTNGAVMDIYGGSLDQGNAILNLYAPSSGSYNGIGILQPASNTSQLQIQFGSSNQVMDGYIVATGAQVYLQDHGGGTAAGGIVADSMFDKASVLHIRSYDLANKQTSPNRMVHLVE